MQEIFLMAKTVSNPDTTLLMHFDGIDGSTNLVNELGDTNLSIVGPARISTLNSKFGPSCLRRTGGDTTSVNIIGDAIIPSDNSDFTVEFWYVMGPGTAIDVDVLRYGALRIYLYNPATRVIAIGNGIFTYYYTLPSAVWTHIAVVRFGGSILIFFDGILRVTDTSQKLYPKSNLVLLGRGAYAAYPVVDYMDELRISKRAIYTANFTPPTEPFIL